MMDTQRLIALIIFSLSALFLWEAWQKHSAPKVQPSSTSSIPARPADRSAATAPAPSAAGGAQAPAGAPPVGATQSAGEPVTVSTDLFDVEIDPAGGDIRRVTMKQQRSALDRSRPLTLMEPDPKHFFVTQTGLLGEGLPNHKTLYEPEQRAYSLAPGQPAIEVRLRARDVQGAEVVKRFVFHRGTYVIDVSYDIANRSDHPLSPYGYFQFLRDGNPPTQEAAQTSAFAGVTTFHGPAVYTEESKFSKIDFKDIDKGKPPPVKKAMDGWIAIVQHYFVSAWLPPPGREREY